MLNALILSVVFLCLTGVVFICVVGSVLPLLLSRSNADDLMPLAEKALKISLVLAGISGVLELVAPGDAVVRNPTIVIVTVITFIWSWGLLYLLRYRERQLLS